MRKVLTLSPLYSSLYSRPPFLSLSLFIETVCYSCNVLMSVRITHTYVTQYCISLIYVNTTYTNTPHFVNHTHIIHSAQNTMYYGISMHLAFSLHFYHLSFLSFTLSHNPFPTPSLLLSLPLLSRFKHSPDERLPTKNISHSSLHASNSRPLNSLRAKIPQCVKGRSGEDPEVTEEKQQRLTFRIVKVGEVFLPNLRKSVAFSSFIEEL